MFCLFILAMTAVNTVLINNVEPSSVRNFSIVLGSMIASLVISFIINKWKLDRESIFRSLTTINKTIILGAVITLLIALYPTLEKLISIFDYFFGGTTTYTFATFMSVVRSCWDFLTQTTIDVTILFNVLPIAVIAWVLGFIYPLFSDASLMGGYIINWLPKPQDLINK